MDKVSELEKHYVGRSSWLRAAVLGANDGLISTASIAIGVSAGNADRDGIILSTLAGIVAGTLSMAAGEYVSVSSQSDVEKADLEREKKELEDIPEIELKELAKIYERRGLKKDTALEVAKQLTEHNALEAHARDELGINEITQARPLEAAFASALSFLFGGFFPLIAVFILPIAQMEAGQYVITIISLAVLGIVAAKTGGSSVKMAVARIVFWGTVAMGVSGLVGYLFNVSTV